MNIWYARTKKEGDKLWEIAKDLNVSMDSLVKLNNIQDPNIIFTGQVLKIPDSSSANIVTADETGAAAPAVQAEKPKPQVIEPKSDIDEVGGADAYGNGGDHPDSKYYVNPDFYNMKSDENLTIISNFKSVPSNDWGNLPGTFNSVSLYASENGWNGATGTATGRRSSAMTPRERPGSATT